MKVKYILSKDKRSKSINELVLNNFPHFIDEPNPNLVMVSGGDGSLLHAIQSCNYFNMPFFGHASGTLNFLMNEISLDEITDFLLNLEKDKILLNEIQTTKIVVEVYKDKTNKLIKIGDAVNDIVLGTNIMGYHSFLINSKDGSFKDFELKGSGICLSTDLGSTGYNFNIGGSVIPLGKDLWSIVGIACNRYINDILSITEITISNNSKKYLPYNIFLDGIKSKIKISNKDKIIIKKGEPVKIAFINKESFLEKRIEISSRFRKS